ncbi:MAG: transposase [Planctomycetaceae bacterium]|nr:transposase [Planctomycetaceae bacterium]
MGSVSSVDRNGTSQTSPKGGQRPYDAVFLFKILILKTLYNLSDDNTELQIRNQLFFLAFLRLDLGDKFRLRNF